MDHDCEWSQDLGSLTLRIPLKRTSKAKIELTAFSNFLKLNHQERGYLRIVDLFGQIDPEQTTWDYLDHAVVVRAVKARAGLWDSFGAVGLGKLEVRERRRRAMEEKERADLERQERLKGLKQELQKKTQDVRLDLEKGQRDQAEAIKREEKESALRYIYGGDAAPRDAGISEAPQKQATATGAQARPTDTVPDFADNPGADADEDPSLAGAPEAKRALQPPADAAPVPEKPRTLLSAGEKEALRQKVRAIREQEKEAPPQPRVFQPVKLNFTPRVFPNLAMREQHLLEAPTAKASRPDEKVEGMNFLALRAKADLFARDRDYASAINAYQESLKLKGDALGTLLNFAGLNIKLLHFDPAAELLAKFEAAFAALDEPTRLLAETAEGRAEFLRKRATLLIWTNRFAEALEVCGQLEQGPADGFAAQCRQKAELRLRTEPLKKSADELFQAEDYTGAAQKYAELLRTDPGNERVLSNLALTHLKTEKLPEALEAIEACLALLAEWRETFDLRAPETNRASEVLAFVVKALLRKAQIQERLGDLSGAEGSVREARRLDEENPLSLAHFRALQRKKALAEFARLKSRYSELMSAGRFGEAAELISQAESLLDFDTNTLDILKNALNKCACFLQLGRNNEVVVECLRGLKILANLRNNTIDRRKLDLVEQHRAELGQLHERFLLRRSSALASLGQPYNAKKDIEELLELNPGNEEARAILQSFNSVLK